MMKRRNFIAAMIGFAGCKPALTDAADSEQVWHITGGHADDGSGGDCKIPPIVVCAPDRLTALTRAGFTVWSQEEWGWFKAREAGFKKGCKEAQ